jgi:Carboxypeptidase regulatory-like domain/TonB dependent receptor
MRYGLTSVLLLVCMVALPCFGQVDRANLEGTVTDSSGGAVSSVKITITAVATGLEDERTTNQYGYYRFPGIALGYYTVVVDHDGFKVKKIENVELRVGETRTLDVVLEVGGRQETITVQAQIEPYERSTAESAIVIGTDQIDNLPTNGRNWSTLTILAPWAQDDGGGDQRTIRFAGRARDDNNFTFDGIDATGIQEQAQKATTRLQISEDAIQEYRVDSALYDAQYGSQAGGQVNVVTKSGTNDYHGTVFGYFRNSVFDAREFIDPPTIPPFRLGQYGLTFGGPIKKDKTFFFINYEGLRQAQPGTTTATVPDPGLQKAVLTTSPVMCPILQAYPWRQSAVAQNQALGCPALHVFPDSSFDDSQAPFDPMNPDSTGLDAFNHGPDTIIHEDTWLARLDHRFSEKTTLYVRAQRDIALTKAPLGNALDQQAIYNRPANYLVALEHTFKPTVLNVAKFGVNRSPFRNPQICNFALAVNSDNFEPLNDCNTDNEVGTTYSFIDDVTITHGRHTFKTGVDIRKVQLNQGITADNTITYTGNLSLINNNIDNLFYRSSWSLHYLRHNFILPYFQDEWKVKPNLTLNLGIRWEYYGVPYEAHKRTTVFDLQNFLGSCFGPNSTNRAIISEPANCPNNPALLKPNYRNWNPRVGVAWTPDRLHGKTVIRAGFGIYSGAAQNDDENAALESDNTRQALAQGVDAPPDSLHFGPGYLANPPDFGTTATSLLQPRALFRHRRDLYVEEWGLTVQHELPAQFLFTTSYLGSHGVRLFARNFENLCDQTTYQTTQTCVRPLDDHPVMVNGQEAFYGDVDVKRDDGSSSYQGLLLSLQRRFSAGLLFQANYTWSHSINDGNVGGGESNAPENALCVRCERGPSIYDIRQNFIANAIYELPFGPRKSYLNSGGVVGRIVGGWSLSGLGTWHTGHPLTVTADIPVVNLPDANSGPAQRPDVVPGVPLTVRPSAANGFQIINPDAFTAPPVDAATGILIRYGNEPNGLIRAPHVWQIDMALMKETKLTERLSFQFGVQAFNIFNHTQFADPGDLTVSLDCTDPSMPPPHTCTASTNQGSFGKINTVNGHNNNNDNFFNDNVGTGLARQLQFMLRFKF